MTVLLFDGWVSVTSNSYTALASSVYINPTVIGFKVIDSFQVKDGRVGLRSLARHAVHLPAGVLLLTARALGLCALTPLLYFLMLLLLEGL